MEPLQLKPYSVTDFGVLNSWIEDATILLQFAGVEFEWPLTPEQLQFHFNRFPEREWCVGYDGDKAVAFGEIIPQENGLPRLGRLIVDSKARNKGYGRRFIKALENRCVERFQCKAMDLYVVAENKQAIECYLKYGFRFLEGQDLIANYKGFEFLCHKMQYEID